MSAFHFNVAGLACQLFGTLFLLLDSVRIAIRLPRGGIRLGDPPEIDKWYYHWGSPIDFGLLLVGFGLYGLALWFSRPQSKARTKDQPEDEKEAANGLQRENPPTEMDREVYRAVTDHFKQDIREFFRRSNFYLVAETLLFYGFFHFSMQRVPKTTLEFSLTTGIAVAGLVVGVFWWVAAKGAVIWINRWRAEVQKLDRELDRFRSYFRVESSALAHPLQSPECITQYLPLFFVFIWIVAWVVVLLAWMGRI